MCDPHPRNYSLCSMMNYAQRDSTLIDIVNVLSCLLSQGVELPWDSCVCISCPFHVFMYGDKQLGWLAYFG